MYDRDNDMKFTDQQILIACPSKIEEKQILISRKILYKALFISNTSN